MKRLWMLAVVGCAVAAGAACSDDDGTGGTAGAGGTTTGTPAGGAGGTVETGGSGGGSPVISCGDSALFVAVHDVCDAMDAIGDGECFCMLGYIWDGEQCVGIGGCECSGADCDKLTQTPEECATDHASCGSVSGYQCGSDALHAATHSACEAMDATGDGECYCMLGYAFDGTDCVAVTGCECTGADCDKLAETMDECVSDHGSCSVEPPDFTCGSEALYANPHDACAAMDAEAVDPCWCMLGYAWDGSACVMLGGCECAGADCDKLFETEEDCAAAHTDC